MNALIILYNRHASIISVSDAKLRFFIYLQCLFRVTFLFLLFRTYRSISIAIQRTTHVSKSFLSRFHSYKPFPSLTNSLYKPNHLFIHQFSTKPDNDNVSDIGNSTSSSSSSSPSSSSNNNNQIYDHERDREIQFDLTSSISKTPVLPSLNQQQHNHNRNYKHKPSDIDNDDENYEILDEDIDELFSSSRQPSSSQSQSSPSSLSSSSSSPSSSSLSLLSSQLFHIRLSVMSSFLYLLPQHQSPGLFYYSFLLSSLKSFNEKDSKIIEILQNIRHQYSNVKLYWEYQKQTKSRSLLTENLLF